jgi:subtilisin
MKSSVWLTLWCAVSLIALAPIIASAQIVNRSSEELVYFDKLAKDAEKNGEVRVIVGLNLDWTPEGYLSTTRRDAQRLAIGRKQDRLLSEITRFNTRLTAQFKFVPFIAVSVDERALEFMKTSPLVLNVREDSLGTPQLAQSVPLVEAPAAWIRGYSGAGQVVAVLDNGVDKFHTFLQNKVVSEACYSAIGENITTFCRSGGTESTAVDSGLPCTQLFSPTSGGGTCSHGTHVAGIATGNGTSFSGVARDAKLISIQVCHGFTLDPGEGLPQSRAIQCSSANVGRGLERVLELNNTTNFSIASVNISIGFSSNQDCTDHPMLAAVINNLHSRSIATVAASGNNGFTNQISAPACIDKAVGVGSTLDTSTAISTFSNSSSALDLLAPGQIITSSISTTTGHSSFGDMAGTSMASPHVAGAWAVLKQRVPNAPVSQVLNALTTTGLPITDPRNGITRPRIRVDPALSLVVPRIVDFDGDNKTDVSVFRPSNGTWYLSRSTAGYSVVAWGQNSDIIAPADFDGDGKTDTAVFRPSTGVWYIVNSSNNSFTIVQFGVNGDIPVQADYDRDGKADIAVWRPSDGVWYRLNSSNGSFFAVQFGVTDDRPAVGDYDGDGKSDLAVFRPSTSTWYLQNSAGFSVILFGLSTDKITPADYDGDGKTDISVFRPSDGVWYRLNSSNGQFMVYQFGISEDISAPGDYDGDGKADFAVFRPSTGVWYLQRTTEGFTAQTFGLSGDVPVPSTYVR